MANLGIYYVAIRPTLALPRRGAAKATSKTKQRARNVWAGDLLLPNNLWHLGARILQQFLTFYTVMVPTATENISSVDGAAGCTHVAGSPGREWKRQRSVAFTLFHSMYVLMTSEKCRVKLKFWLELAY